ncbi:FecCD family ABC transporter permease [Marinicrinis lubricantis]|uniref:FecCD family ABC transporter permease n=1 Tax=Marinicrinis lubricantis TaxID=2086470 RepID=A0ABW1IPI9_9BACL
MLKSSARRYLIVMSFSLAAVGWMVYVSLTSGVYEMRVMDVIRTLLRVQPHTDYDLIIWEFRLPRILIAILVGMGLAVAGAVVQSITRNDLADPGILGINAGASASMVIFLFFYQGSIHGSGLMSVMAMPLFGLIGGLLSAVLIYIFSWKNGRMDAQRLILTGIAVASGLGAITLFFTMKMNPGDFEMAAVWNSGSVYNANWKYIASIVPWLAVLLPLIVRKAYLLDLFRLREESQIGLGISVQKERALLLLYSIGIVSACVSVSGGIGFIGLMAPHIAKQLVSGGHRRFIPLCAVIGALLVLTADYIGKTWFEPVELPAGMMIAIIGVPYFVLLLYRKNGRY